MDKRQIDCLIDDFESFGAQIKKLQEARAKIVEQFAVGRTEGENKAIYVGGPSKRSRIDMSALKRYVTKSVIDACRVYSWSNGAARVVPKLKPKKAKR